MLTLKITENKSVRISGPCVITNLGRDRWGFEAPPETIVVRTELEKAPDYVYKPTGDKP